MGLGIESSSFRDGLPHESVISADVLTGGGEIVHATRDNEASDLLDGLAELLRHARLRASRLRIELAPVKPFVALRHVRFDDAASLRGRRPRPSPRPGLRRASRSTSSTGPCSPPTSST